MPLSAPDAPHRDPNLTLDFGGETLRVLPERALAWDRGKTVFLADPHFGKSAAFRALGIPAPEGTAEDLARLDRVLDLTQATRLVVLGDFFHARQGRSEATLSHLAAWRARHPRLAIVLVRGNHDTAAGDPPDNLDIACVTEPWVVGPFVARHMPGDDPRGPVLAGHLHPGLALRDRNGAGLRMPCLLASGRQAVLPAFGGFTGLKILRPRPGQRVFAFGPDTVIALR